MFKAQKMSVDEVANVMKEMFDLKLVGVIKIEVLPIKEFWHFDVNLIPLTEQAKLILTEAMTTDFFYKLDAQFEAVI